MTWTFFPGKLQRYLDILKITQISVGLSLMLRSMVWQRLWCQMNQGQIVVPLLWSCVTLYTSLNLSEPQSLHLWNREEKGFLQRLNEVVYKTLSTVPGIKEVFNKWHLFPLLKPYNHYFILKIKMRQSLPQPQWGRNTQTDVQGPRLLVSCQL